MREALQTRQQKPLLRKERLRRNACMQMALWAVLQTLRKKKEQSVSDKENAALVKEAMSLRTLYHKTTSVHAARMEQMRTESRWADLATPNVLAKLQELHTQVETAAKAPFTIDILTHELAHVKKSFAKDMGQFFSIFAR